jgi:hypothetical protein
MFTPSTVRAKEEHEEALQDYEARQLVSAAKQKNAKDDLKKAVKCGGDPYEMAVKCGGPRVDQEP